MAFRGWRAEAIEFFEGLEADNSKEYWQAHKTVYEQEVRAPMEGLLAELEPAYGDGKIFRPYRDVRFSADKSPYKTNIAATIGRRYVQLNADAFGVGCGRWEMSSRTWSAIGRRLTMTVPGASSSSWSRRRARRSRDLRPQVLKTAPRGYPKEHPRIELLRYKGLIGWREWPVGPWLKTKRVKDRVIEVFDASAPLDAWLERNV
jgi:uncharacterized protein (TIGR02453 family)